MELQEMRYCRFCRTVCAYENVTANPNDCKEYAGRSDIDDKVIGAEHYLKIPCNEKPSADKNTELL